MTFGIIARRHEWHESYRWIHIISQPARTQTDKLGLAKPFVGDDAMSPNNRQQDSLTTDNIRSPP